MSVFLVILLLLQNSCYAQLTVGGWFFPVSVPPPDPRDNTVYDEDVTFPDADPVNLTHQEIKDYYEKDKLEKWNSLKPNLQPIYRKDRLHDNDFTTTTSTTHNPLEIAKSQRFLPNSGIPKFIPSPLGLPVNEEPVITMSMTPIKSLIQPEEISMDIIRNNRSFNREVLMPEVNSSTEKMRTTKSPFIYEIPKSKSFDDPLSVVSKERDMMKLKRDVFRLRNEMNLVKALLNKLYKRSYRKQRDIMMKKANDSTTRLSAVQSNENNEFEWRIRGRQNRRNHRNIKV